MAAGDLEMAQALMWESIQALAAGRRPRGDVAEILADFRAVAKERV